MVPALSCVTGAPASIVPLNPIEAQRRLHHLCVSFIRLFATSERPLAFVLDDCQWLDAASAEVLSAILTSPDSSHVLVLAAFRGNDASDVPSLAGMRQALQAAEAVVSVPLVPLSVGAIAEILARSLRTAPPEAQRLAPIVMRKTNGNPFFIGQLLASLQRQGTLRLNVERGCWSADLRRAEAHPACDNVGALMAERLDRLSDESAKLLSAAACLGMRFELEAVAGALDKPIQVCLELVRDALVQRLISEVSAEALSQPPSFPPSRPSPGQLPAAYVFEHSGVRQAALSRASDVERVRYHARIGRILRQRLPNESSSSASTS
jgi:predicted ATPase